jgi:hypothetical protein
VQDIDKSISKTENEIFKSPPLFVAGIANVTPLTTLLNNIAVKNEEKSFKVVLKKCTFIYQSRRIETRYK